MQQTPIKIHRDVTPKTIDGIFVILLLPVRDLEEGYFGWAGKVNEPIYGRYDTADEKGVYTFSYNNALAEYLDLKKWGYPCKIIQIR